MERTSREDSAAYFHSRPPGSRLGAWVSKQSEVIDSRQILDARLEQMDGAFRRTARFRSRRIGADIG